VVIHQRFYPNLYVHQHFTVSVFHFPFLVSFPLFPIACVTLLQCYTVIVLHLRCCSVELLQCSTVAVKDINTSINYSKYTI